MTHPQPNRRRFAAALSVLGAVAISILLATPASARSADDIDDPSELLPDIAVLIDRERTGERPAEAVVQALVEDLSEVPGVVRVVVDDQLEDGTVLYIDVDDTAEDVPSFDAVEAAIRSEVGAARPDGSFTVGGSALVDRSILDRYGNSEAAVAVLALLLGLLSAAVVGRRRALALAITGAFAVMAAGSLSGRLADGFDGTMASTGLPGALAGLVLFCWIAARLVDWFREPAGGDGADTIRMAAFAVAPEVLLSVAATVVVALVLGLLGSGGGAVSSVAVGAATAAVVTVAALVPALTALGGDGEPVLPDRLPTGRDLALPVLAAIGLVTTLAFLPALGGPDTDLDDGDVLPDDDPAAAVDSVLLVGGDATKGIVLVVPESAEVDMVDRWVESLAEVDGVAWVDTADARIFSGGRADDAVTTLVPADRGDLVIAVPDVATRTATGADLVDELAIVPLPGGQPELHGPPVAASGAVGSLGTLALAVVVFAVAAGIVVAVLAHNASLALLTAGLRLVTGGAVVGVTALVTSGATIAESLTALAVLGLGSGLYEIQFVRSRYGDSGGTTALVGDDAPGRAALLAVIVTGLAGLALVVAALFGGGPGVGWFGAALLVAAMLEAVVGLSILRPALLGQRAAFHTAARPVRLALHSGADRQLRGRDMPEDPTWRRVVVDLIQTEFLFQADPEGADLEAVFVPDTPLHRQAEEHHAGLAGSGLRVSGRSPRLRSLKTISARRPITLAVTVDHPSRQLVHSSGKVVGVRKPERRSGVLWLVEENGHFRIAESIDLGSVPLDEDADGVLTEGPATDSPNPEGPDPDSAATEGPDPDSAATDGADPEPGDAPDSDEQRAAGDDGIVLDLDEPIEPGADGAEDAPAGNRGDVVLEPDGDRTDGEADTTAPQEAER